MNIFYGYLESIEALKHSEQRESEFKSIPKELWEIADVASKTFKDWLGMSRDRFVKLTPKDQAVTVNQKVDTFLDKYFDDEEDASDLQSSLKQNRNRFITVLCKRIIGGDVFEANVSSLSEMLSSVYTKDGLIKSFVDYCYDNKKVVEEWQEQYNISIGDGKWATNSFKDKLEFIRVTLTPLDQGAIIARIAELQSNGYNVSQWFQKMKGVAGGVIN